MNFSYSYANDKQYMFHNYVVKDTEDLHLHDQSNILSYNNHTILLWNKYT